MTRRRVVMHWTHTAKQALARLPQKVRRGLLQKADLVAQSSDPRRAGKPLVDPLQGYYRIAYSRYRALYTVAEREDDAAGPTLMIQVLFVTAGVRKAGDKRDVYETAMRLWRLGILRSEREDE